jgi:hypothetical protein
MVLFGSGFRRRRDFVPVGMRRIQIDHFKMVV